MARRQKLNEEAFSRRILQGYGRGKGINYRPFFTMRDFPSIGRVHRPLGLAFARVHHLMSDLEWAALLAYECLPRVTEIWDQYYLEREETQQVASRLGYRHPMARGIVWPMTTDLVVTIGAGPDARLQPVCVKYTTDMAKPRVREKLAIEAGYWEQQGCQLAYFTEESLDFDTLRTLEATRPFYRLDGVVNPRPEQVPVLIEDWRHALHSPPATPVSSVCTELDSAHGLVVGGAQAILYHLIATARVVTARTPALTLRRLVAEFEWVG